MSFFPQPVKPNRFCGSCGTVKEAAEKVGKNPEAKAVLRVRAVSLD